MKFRNSIFAVTALLGLGMVLTVPVQAQDNSAPDAGGRRGRMGRQQRGGMRNNPIMTAFQAVNPTQEQTEKFRTLMQTTMQNRRGEMAGLRDMTPEQRQAKMQEMSQKMTDEVAALLTPDQQKKFREELEKAQKAQRAERGGPMAALETLNLTPEQKTKIQPIAEDMMKQMMNLRQDDSLAPEEKQAKAKELFDQMKAKVRPLLTTEQQSKFDKLRFGQGMGGNRGGGRRNAGV